MENSGTASHLTTNNLNAESLFRHLVTCGICMGLYVDPVALLDCLHLACGSCAVEWLKQSSTCHQCRENVRSVRDSHHTSAIVEAYKTLAPGSSLCQERTLEELYLLREKYRPGQSVSIQGQEGDDSSLEEIESTDSDGEAPMSWSLNRNVGFTEPRFTVNLDDLALPDNQCPFCDPSNTSGYVCPEPCLERDLHAMPIGHTICGACTRLLPLREHRRDIQCCVCTRTTCREMEQVCRSINPHELKLCVLKDIVFPAHWTIPLTHAFGENDYEREVFSTYISSIGLDLQGLFQEIVSFRGSNNLPRANWHGTGYDPYDSSVVDINDKTCQHCALDLVEASLFDWWLSKRRSADLPDEVRSRPDCWYGIECRTARHNPGHAHSYNHICRPTQGRNREDRHQDVPDNGIRAVCESDNLDDYFPAYSPSQVIFRDIGNEPVFMCSVIYRDRRGMSTIPGKTTMWNQSQVAVYFGVDGSEHEHDGVVQILIDTRNMRWVRISKGIIPPGCRPVVGGRMNVDGSSQELYHCAVWWCGQRVPGRTSRRMGHAIITWGGFEWRIEDQFELLCWN